MILLLGGNWTQKVKGMRDIIDLNKRLETGAIANLAEGTHREFTDNIIKKSQQEGVIGLGKEFDKIIADLGGLDGKGVELVRAHIIKKMMDKAKTEMTKGAEMFTETLNPKKLKFAIRDLQNNPYLKKFFTNDQIDALQHYNLYSTALAGQSDVGGMIAAGETAKNLTDGIFNVRTIIETGFSLIKHDIVAQLLARNTHASLFKKLNVEDALSLGNLQIINALLAETAKEIIGETTG